MQLEIVTVTPSIAAMFMKKNVVNRNPSAAQIEFFERELREGTFKTTHHGIALNKNDELIDGQTRLQAIINTGISAQMVVATDCDATDAMDWPVDDGRKRAFKDIAGISAKNAAAVTCALEIYFATKRSFSTTEKKVAMERLLPLFEKVDRACSTQRRIFTRATIRLPVMLRMNQSYDYPALQYRALVLQEYDRMTPAIQGFNRKLTTPQLRLVESEFEQMARAWVAFDPQRSANSRQDNRSADRALEEMKAELLKLGFSKMDSVANTKLARVSRSEAAKIRVAEGKSENFVKVNERLKRDESGKFMRASDSIAGVE